MFRTELSEYDQDRVWVYVTQGGPETFTGKPSSLIDPWNCYMPERIQIYQDLYILLQQCQSEKIQIQNIGLFFMDDTMMAKEAGNMNWRLISPREIIQKIATRTEHPVSMATVDTETENIRNKFRQYTEAIISGGRCALVDAMQDKLKDKYSEWETNTGKADYTQFRKDIANIFGESITISSHMSPRELPDLIQRVGLDPADAFEKLKELDQKYCWSQCCDISGRIWCDWDISSERRNHIRNTRQILNIACHFCRYRR